MSSATLSPTGRRSGLFVHDDGTITLVTPPALVPAVRSKLAHDFAMASAALMDRLVAELPPLPLEVLREGMVDGAYRRDPTTVRPFEPAPAFEEARKRVTVLNDAHACWEAFDIPDTHEGPPLRRPLEWWLEAIAAAIDELAGLITATVADHAATYEDEPLEEWSRRIGGWEDDMRETLTCLSRLRAEVLSSTRDIESRAA